MQGEIDAYRYQYVTPQFELVCCGQTASELRQAISSVDVSESMTAANTFSVQLQDHVLQTGGLRWLDDPACQPGATWQITLGYPSDRRRMLDGYLANVSVSFNDTLGPQITLSGADRAQQALSVSGAAYAIDGTRTDAQVVEDLAHSVGLEADVDATRGEFRRNTVSGATIRDLIDALATRNSYEVFLEGRTVRFKQPGSRLRQPRPGLTWGKNLLSLNAQLDISGRVSSVRLNAVNRTDGSIITGTAAAGSERRVDHGGGPTASELVQRSFGESELHISNRPVSTQSEGDEEARAALERASAAMNGVSCTVVGDPMWWPGMEVTLGGVGNGWLRGIYTVRHVGHSVSAQGYRCSLRMERNSA